MKSTLNLVLGMPSHPNIFEFKNTFCSGDTLRKRRLTRHSSALRNEAGRIEHFVSSKTTPGQANMFYVYILQSIIIQKDITLVLQGILRFILKIRLVFFCNEVILFINLTEVKMLSNRKNYILLAILLLSAFIIHADNHGDMKMGYMDIPAEKAMELIKNNPDLLIIDVSPMWEDGHLPGALSFPLGDGSFKAALPSWDKDKMYLIYCHGDAPAIKAAQMLVDSGFKHVYRLKGNYNAWVKAGYEIEVHSYKDISALQLKQMMDENPDLIVIDVSPMYDKGHIPGSLSFPLGNGSFKSAMASWDKDEKYVIYCHGDAPAIEAAQMLVDGGFKHVYRLEGNFAAWKGAGYPLEMSK